MSQASPMQSPVASPQQTAPHTSAPTPSVPQIAFLGQSVIPLVNKLQDIFAQLGTGASSIDLPQVAVVGSQSSGKSSVLEALVGRDFLPRGQDICTRRPLVLQLVQTVRREHAERGGDVAEWGEFLHLPGRRFTDFQAIRKEIQAETDRESGVNRGVSEKQIRLKIFSPNVLNITLVDLPGITKVPTGDQPTDIEARIRTMVLSYIKHSTCLILAVSPANADLANSDALQIARIADPDGSRTIGVISKLDIMDRGTDARNILLGSIVPLKLGYIGVINRSQEDINTNKSIRDAIAYEEQFFRSRPVYHSLADRCGIQQLAIKLNAILVKHIQSILPDLRARINAQIVTLQKELVGYGEVTESKSGQGALLLNILTRYSKSFGETVDGKNENMSTHELSGGARIHYIFQAIFVKSLEDVDPCDDLSDEDIRTAIQNATGPRSVLFVPEVPFEMLVRRQIARLLEPSLQCARFVYEELVKISHRCETVELQRFPVLRRRVDDVVSNFLREGLIPAETMIGHLIEMEMDYINTSHPSFVGGSKAVEMALQDRRSSREASDWKDSGADRLLAVPDKAPKARGILSRSKTPPPDLGRRSNDGNSSSERASTSSSNGLNSGGWGITSIFHTERSRGELTSTRVFSETMIGSEPLVSVRLKEPPQVLRAADAATEQETIEIAVTRVLLKSYYDIVRKNIQDQVPKAIMHFLVNHVKRELHSVFIRKLYREPLFDEVLQEREEIAQKRRRCKEILKVLQQASYTLEDLPLEDSVTSAFSGVTLGSNELSPSSIFAANIAAAHFSSPKLLSSKSMFKKSDESSGNGSTSPMANGPSLGPGLGGYGGRM